MKKLDLQKIIREELQKVIKEAAASKAQQQAAGIALSVKRGDAPASKLKDAGKAMVKMSEKELEKIAGTKHDGLPKKVKKESTSLKEGYAWERSERKFGEPLPTLASIQKAHEAKQSVLKEVMAPSFKAKHKDNNLVAAVYFSWNKAESNNATLWAKVIEIIEQQDCKLVNYVVTDSVCEFEFKPSVAINQDQLEETKNNVELALKPLSSQWTGYDVYIVGN